VTLSIVSTAAANREALRAAQEPLFLATIRRCFASHPHYQAELGRLGLTADDFRSIDDVAKLPLTHKSQLMADPESFRLRLEDDPSASLEERTLWGMIYTAGSSNRPTPTFETSHDLFSRIDQMRRACEIGGVLPEDVVLNLFPVTSVPHQGFLSAQWGTFGVGAASVAAMTGRGNAEFPIHNDLDSAIRLAERTRATVLWGISTYVRKVIMRAEELGADLSAVRLVYAMGEACPPGMRDDVRRRLQRLGARAVRVLSGYGFTEMQGPALECDELSGFHLPTPTQYLFEILDPETYEPVGDGEDGLVVITHLNRRGTVLLRYVVGDVCALSHETCPHCGRDEPRFTRSPYRVGNLIKVKGTLVNPASIHEELTHLQSSGLVEYQMALVKDDPADEFSADTLLIRLACESCNADRLRHQVVAAVRRSAEVTPKVELFPPDHFSEHVQQYKFKRFLDERGSPSN
jgi:phenylacetate-coenzyme A ligase PaaK-like adenylate-forming protein